MTTQTAQNTNIYISGDASDKSSLLRWAFRGNALFSLISGSALIIDAGMIDEFLELGSTFALVITGVDVLLWAAFVYWVASRKEIKPTLAKLIIAGDFLWVIASAALIAFDPFSLTTDGKWAIGILAVIVALFGDVQFFGLRRLQR